MTTEKATTPPGIALDNEALDKLEALARAATPGPWLHRHDPGNPPGVQHGVKLAGEFGAWIADFLDNADRSTEGGAAGDRNAQFVAAANPTTILALIAQARAAQPQPSATPAEPAGMQAAGQSIDNDEFWRHVIAYCKGVGSEGRALVDYVMSWHRAQLSAARQGQVVAWAYECVQPGTDGQTWCEFIDRVEPKPQEGVRNIQPLYAALQPTAAPTPHEQEARAAVPGDVRAYLMSQDLYSLLTDIQNGTDSPATCGLANRLIIRLDKLRGAIANPVPAQAGMLPEAQTDAARDVQDAARWRALLGTARIRPLGSAGLKTPENRNYAHLGLELWTTYGRDYSAELIERMDRENAIGIEWLTKFVDIAMAAQDAAKGAAALEGGAS